jgi:hypothetical protein
MLRMAALPPRTMLGARPQRLRSRRMAPTVMKPFDARALRIISLIAILLFGLWLRGRDLAQTPASGDESESAMNALTILSRGIPGGTYLGLPIYENILTERWAGNPEYEFRDSSYSANDVAIYHGWLPLYSMAASFKAFGIAPDLPSTQPRVRHSIEEIHRRVIAARLPAVVFGLLFMIFLYLAAREMFGVDAALAAAAVGAIGRPFVYAAREARYHSATLAISTGCCWAIWRTFTHGRWRDFLIAAALLSALFYTHLLAFVVAVGMFGLLTPFMLRRRRCLAKIIVTGAIVAGCAVPWVLLSGFLGQTAHIPPARQFLSFPADLIYYPLVRIPYLLLPLAGLIWLGAVYFFHDALPRRVTRPLDLHQRELAFLLGWIALGFLAFLFLIPAASYFYKRMTLPMMGPGVVWGSILFAAAARSLWRDKAQVLAPVLFVATITAGNMAHLWFLERPDAAEAYATIERLRAETFAPDTKLYCTPNQQLALTFMAGLPVQSVAPIRKSFLDTYRGPIVLIDSAPPMDPITWERIQTLARARRVKLSDEQAMETAGPLSARSRKLELVGRVASIEPPLEPASEFADVVLADQRQRTAEDIESWTRGGRNNPLLRNYDVGDWSAWWPLFFYRFVDPEMRMGGKLNYADRIRSARAEVLDNSWVIFHCPRLKVAGSSLAPTGAGGDQP